jgi:hypothetical protein
MRVKEKFQRLSQLVAPAFAEVEAEIQPHLSEEFPSIVNGKKVDAQCLYYCRNAGATAELARFLEKTELKPEKIFNLAPQEKHAVLTLVLRREMIELGFAIHAGAWVDRRNLAAKLHQTWNREKLKQLLGGLGKDVVFGFEGATLPATEVELSALETLADDLVNDERRFVAWRQVAAEEALRLGADVLMLIERSLTELLPLYQFAAWSKANDQIAFGEKIRAEKAEQRKNATSFRVGDKVRIAAGIFSGKVGVVSGIDSKAQVKVQVGAMAVTVPGSDLLRK